LALLADAIDRDVAALLLGDGTPGLAAGASAAAGDRGADGDGRAAAGRLSASPQARRASCEPAALAGLHEGRPLRAGRGAAGVRRGRARLLPSLPGGVGRDAPRRGPAIANPLPRVAVDRRSGAMHAIPSRVTH